MKDYVASFELIPLEDNELFGACSGVAVCGFVHTTDIKEALNLFEKDLKEMSFRIMEVEYISLYGEMQWDKKTQKEYDDYMTEAERSSKIIYSKFWAYK